MVCSAFESAGAKVVHVNTQDRRTVFNTGVLDPRNVWLALVQAARFAWHAALSRVSIVYLPISQNRWGYARDALLMTIARLFRRPVAVHLRGSGLQGFYRSRGHVEAWIVRRTLGWSAMAIALTPGLRDVYSGLVPPERVRVLENAITDPWPDGIDATLEARERRAAADPQALRLLYLSNDFATKGAETAVRAVSDPGLEHATLRMVGAPPPEVATRTEELARSLGVGDRVELLGGLVGREKLEQFEWADAFVYPTENDGQPLVIIEAMAAGLPIVASSFGGIPETLSDTGVLVDPGTPSALAGELARLIESPGLRRERGVAARERYVARYTPAPYQERFADLFADLLPVRGA